MINFASTEKLGKKNSEFLMGFEPTTLRDLVGCSPKNNYVIDLAALHCFLQKFTDYRNYHIRCDMKVTSSRLKR